MFMHDVGSARVWIAPALYVSLVAAVSLMFFFSVLAVPFFVHAQSTGTPSDTGTTVVTPVPPTVPTITNETTVTPGIPDTGSVDTTYAGLSRDGWVALGIIAVAVLLIVVGWGMAGSGVDRTTVRY